MKRSDLIESLEKNQDEIRDIIVIGGGATGLGIAFDAASRGYRTLLLEQSDFAKATSSRSTKLVHGGVRYLAQGDLLLVREALRERGIILKNAPHLCQNQEFVIPLYSLWDIFLYWFGLKFYDILSGRLSLGKSYFISVKEAVERLPVLNQKGLKGGIVYHDGQFDDARMALDLAKGCNGKGGIALNYFRVIGLNKDSKGKISSVTAKDMVSEKKYTFKSRLVINATGVFADEIEKLDNPDARQTIRPSQGVHIVLDASFLKSKSAIMIPKTSDGRVLFAIPWFGHVVIGTTDTPVDEISLEPLPFDREIDFILETASRFLTRAPKREDVLSVFAGLRPLAANPDKPQSTKEVSRRHKIILSASGLLTIIGGKWTTYRLMAEETINRAIKAGILEKKKCLTKNLSLSSHSANSVNPEFLKYGAGEKEIAKLIRADQELSAVLHPELSFTRAEIIWICRNELPVNIEDILARRTRSLFLNARASVEAAPLIADIMTEEMGFDKKWKADQIASYKDLVKNYL
ncbi:MAG: glycerol-3-phosphate dehydrogenase/oxidase [Bacteroidales bacterium]|nr:glycerol-3-phosphate dehydrogenase/oxidase [Bacteroidales bacterium]MCB9013825.1 glycerol-3-phosphate dehydrogenase/oxidase [Bacteroidales bacterium]